MCSSDPKERTRGRRTAIVVRMLTNRRARHDYDLLETFEAGMQLRGSEVKALRQG